MKERSKEARERAIKNYHEFDSSKITGLMDANPDASVSGNMFIVNGKLYYFNPSVVVPRNTTRFSQTAQKGDSIYKDAFADTLFLFKGDEVYSYRFHHFDTVSHRSR